MWSFGAPAYYDFPTDWEPIDIALADYDQNGTLDVAVARAEELAALDPRAYAGTVRALRGDVVETMGEQVAADRARGSTPVD